MEKISRSQMIIQLMYILNVPQHAPLSKIRTVVHIDAFQSRIFTTACEKGDYASLEKLSWYLTSEQENTLCISVPAHIPFVVCRK